MDEHRQLILNVALRAQDLVGVVARATLQSDLRQTVHEMQERANSINEAIAELRLAARNAPSGGPNDD